MSQKAKVGFVTTGKAVDSQYNVENQATNEPAAMPEPVATKPPPPDDAMVQQILERQAVFGF